MADDTKTKQQLIAELGSLEGQLELTSRGHKPLEAEDGEPVIPGPTSGPTLGPMSGPILAPRTRRGILSWAAPVLLSLGTVLKPATARAASTDDFVAPLPPPARTGRCIPTPSASAAPAPAGSSSAPPATAEAESAPDEPASVVTQVTPASAETTKRPQS